MNEEEAIKRNIRERLQAAPKYRQNCTYCGQYACTTTKPVQIIHFDCWKKEKYELAQKAVVQIAG